nr:pentapeptide repeat-containing protein [Chroococcidiopsis sp. CCMEE 29]
MLLPQKTSESTFQEIGCVDYTPLPVVYRANLRGADLSEANLSGANLKYKSLRNASR